MGNSRQRWSWRRTSTCNVAVVIACHDKEYLRARELGIELPEATPTFQVGLLATCEAPEPVEVTMPESFPLERCYRFDPDYPGGTDTDEANVHLLAALGQFVVPFVPVNIRKDYDGYSWTKLPTIGKVSVTVGKTRHTAGVWSGTLACVDELAITVATSDGRGFFIPSVHGQGAAARRRVAVG